MASITLPATAVPADPVRPLNVLRDLPQVADLIEQCFNTTIDDEGQSYVRQMRRASRDRDFLSWAGSVMGSASMPLAGYVWEENGKIVGNTSLVLQAHRGRKIAMIANVATHPSHRRRGIGRALTERAMAGARQRGAKELWLQVRDDNPAAMQLYSGLGFTERARRTTYRSGSAGLTPTRANDGTITPAPVPADTQDHEGRAFRVTRPDPRNWSRQREWLERAHPDELGWYARWNWDKLGPGFRNTIYRFFVQYDVRQWAAAGDAGQVASVSWIPTLRVPDALWIAASHEGEAAVPQLLVAARRVLAQHPKITVEYPAGELEQEIQSAGFEAFRTLVWMRATTTQDPRIDQQKET
jgi:ribosomal protein S18 acetylase RimI-like enzyme